MKSSPPSLWAPNSASSSWRVDAETTNPGTKIWGRCCHVLRFLKVSHRIHETGVFTLIFWLIFWMINVLVNIPYMNPTCIPALGMISFLWLCCLDINQASEIPSVTPPKTNMTIQIHHLSRCISFEHGDFPASHISFQRCKWFQMVHCGGTVGGTF